MRVAVSHGYVVVGISHLDQLAEHRRLQRGVPEAERSRDKARYARLRAVSDRRCRAVVDMDGGLFGDRPDAPSSVPCLMLYAERSAGCNDSLRDSIDAEFDEIVLPGAKHVDFSDATVLWLLLKWVGVLGRAAGARLSAQKNRHVRAFLDRHVGPVQGRAGERAGSAPAA